MKDLLQLVGALVLVLGLGLLGWRGIFGGAQRAPLVVESVEGDVKLRVADGEEAAVVGQPLDKDARLRSGASGSAILNAGGETRLELKPSSSLRVVGADERGVLVELEGGRVQARVRPGSPSLGVLAEGRRVDAEDASFEVGVDEAGNVAVEAEEGRVALTGFGDTDTLQAGERALAGDHGVVAGPIPEELLLHVEWPTWSTTRHDSVALAGTTDPGARVSVRAGPELVSARADGDGRFELTVPLEQGDNPLTVEAEGVLGRTRRSDGRLERDDQEPTAEIEIRF